MKNNPLQIVVSATFYGGIGGNERHLKALIESLPEHRFHVFAERVFDTGFVPISGNHDLNRPLDKDTVYDLYIYLRSCSPPYIGDQYAFKRKVIVQCGNRVFDREHLFDDIFMQGTNGLQLCADHDKCKLVVSNPATTWPEGAAAVNDLPRQFYLTVFNPLGRTKGAHVMYMVAKYGRIPIVWCYDDSTGWDFSNVPHMAQVIPLKNLSQEQIHHLYRNATAYVSFSLSEGYGWSVADAFMYDLPIISRDTGIVTLIRDQPGIHVYRDERELADYLRQTAFATPDYDKSLFDDLSYRTAIDDIMSRA